MKFMLLITLLLLIAGVGTFSAQEGPTTLTVDDPSSQGQSSFSTTYVRPEYTGLSPGSDGTGTEIFGGVVISLIAIIMIIITWEVMTNIKNRTVEAWFGRSLLMAVTLFFCLLSVQGWFDLPFPNAYSLPDYEADLLEADMLDWEHAVYVDSMMHNFEIELRLLLGQEVKVDPEFSSNLLANVIPLPIGPTLIKHIRVVQGSDVLGFFEGDFPGFFGGHVVANQKSYTLPQLEGGESLVMLGWNDDGEVVRMVIPGMSWLKNRLEIVERNHRHILTYNGWRGYGPTYHRNIMFSNHWDTTVALIGQLVNKAAGNADALITLYEDSRDNNTELILSGRASMIDNNAFFVDSLYVDDALRIPSRMPREHGFNGTVGLLTLQYLGEELMDADKYWSWRNELSPPDSVLNN